MPAARINRTLGLALPGGDVTISKAAHRHIAVDHPIEYPAIMAALPAIVANPAFVGQDPKHPHAFYPIDALTTRLGSFALVAIGFQLTIDGTYAIKSAYGIKSSQLTGRVKAGRVVPLLP